MGAWRWASGDWRRWKHGIVVWGCEWFSCGCLFSENLDFFVDQFSKTIVDSMSANFWRWGWEHVYESVGINIFLLINFQNNSWFNVCQFLHVALWEWWWVHFYGFYTFSNEGRDGSNYFSWSLSSDMLHFCCWSTR